MQAQISTIWLKPFAAWLIILGCAFLNGALREIVLLPNFGKPVAFVVSGILLSACIIVVAIALVSRLERLKLHECLFIGFFWLGLTLAFEFGFGHFVQHRSWPDLFEAYTFQEGNIWPVVLLVTLLAPLVAAWLGKKAPVSA